MSPALAGGFFTNSTTWEARGELNKGAVYKDVGRGGEIDKGWRPILGAARSLTSPYRKDIKGDTTRLCYQSKSKAPSSLKKQRPELYREMNPGGRGLTLPAPIPSQHFSMDEPTRTLEMKVLQLSLLGREAEKGGMYIWGNNGILLVIFFPQTFKTI